MDGGVSVNVAGGRPTLFAVGALAMASGIAALRLYRFRRGTDGRTAPANSFGREAATLVTSATILGVAAVVLLVASGLPATAVGARPPTPVALADGLGLGLALWGSVILLEVLLSRLGVADSTLRWSRASTVSPSGLRQWLVFALGVVPAVAIGEELCFRGALVGGVALAGAVPVPLLVGLSAIGFAGYHGRRGMGEGLLGLSAGGVLAVGFVASGSLAVPVVAHAVVLVGATLERANVFGTEVGARS